MARIAVRPRDGAGVLGRFAGSGQLLRDAGWQDFFFAQNLRAVELGNRGPAQLADFLGDPLGTRFELRRVEVPAAKLNLPPAMFDIGSIVLGKELDLRGVACKT